MKASGNRCFFGGLLWGGMVFRVLEGIYIQREQSNVLQQKSRCFMKRHVVGARKTGFKRCKGAQA